MNLTRLRTKRVLIPAGGVLALALAGGIWTTAASADSLHGPDRDRVAAAAVEAAGGGTVTDAERSDDAGVAYEVDLRKADGTEVEVELDRDLNVVRNKVDAEDADHGPGDRSDDRPVTASQHAAAAKAATAALGGGTVTDVEASDDGPVAYEVEVTKADGTEWDVDLGADYRVLTKTIDD